MQLRFRQWKPDDTPSLVGLACAHPARSLHPIDCPYRIALALSDDLSYTQLCESPDGQERLLGWALLGAWQLLDVVTAPGPEAVEVETTLLKWALARWADGPGRRKRHIWAPVRESDGARRQLLSGQYQRLGLGRALMSAGFERLRRLGASCVHIECYSGGDAARAVYTSAGFAPQYRVLHYVVRFESSP